MIKFFQHSQAWKSSLWYFSGCKADLFTALIEIISGSEMCVYVFVCAHARARVHACVHVLCVCCSWVLSTSYFKDRVSHSLELNSSASLAGQ